MRSPLVSVVVPCLNRAHYLRPTIDSILSQDYPNIECIVIDGGSTDGSVEILKEYEDRITWVSEPDRGIPDGINRGFKKTGGDILAWLNADDIWKTPDAVSIAVAFLNDNPDVDVVYGDCGAIDEKGNRIGDSYLHEWDLEYAVMNCDHCIPQPAAFMRRTILEKVGWLDATRQKHDHDLWLRIGLVGQIRHIHELLAHDRRHAGNLGLIGRNMAPICVQITKKFFTLPGVPESLKSRKKRALSNACIKGMAYGYHGWDNTHDWSVVLKYARKALWYDWSNRSKVFSYLQEMTRHSSPERFRHRLQLFFLYALDSARNLWRILFPRKESKHTKETTQVNLAGERDIECSFIAANIPEGPGRALDFGAGAGLLGLTMVRRGFDVTAIDLMDMQWMFVHPTIKFIKGDILKTDFPPENFDVVISCSTVEHVGLAGRYGVDEDLENGDLQAMARLAGFMKPGAMMLLTVPVGKDGIFKPMTRIYGKQRLVKLLEGFRVEKEEYWVKNNSNCWIRCSKEEAISYQAEAGSSDWRKNTYALGCFVLFRDN